MPSSDCDSSVTQRDLARRLGLNQSTVSRALRDDSRIPEAQRLKIQVVAKEIGYKPNAIASALVSYKRFSRAKPVQAALAWLNVRPDPKSLRARKEFDFYWRGAADSAEKFGYRLEEFVVGKDLPPSRLEKVLLTRNIKGIVIAPMVDFRWIGAIFIGIAFLLSD